MIPRRVFLGAVGALGLAARQQRAIAQTGVAPARFLFVYTPCGREPSWRTETPGAGFRLAPTLQMFEPYRARMCLLDGLTIPNFDYKEYNAHLAGVALMLSGRAPLKRPGTFEGAIPGSAQRTFDHLLGDKLGGTTPIRNIVVGGRDRNNNAGALQVSYTAPGQAELPIHEPDKAFTALFAGLKAAMGDTAARQTWEKEILGLGQTQAALIRRQLGHQEIQQLQAYETSLEDAFKRVAAPAGLDPVSSSCGSIALDRLQAGLVAPEYAGTPTEAYQVHHDLQSRVLAAALACGRTRVATYVMASHLGSMTVPGGKPEDPKRANTPFAGAHHLHDTAAVAHYQAYDRYYGARIKFLLDELNRYPEGSGTVLDNTVVVWSTEIAWDPIQHDHDRHFVALFGGAPGRKLRMGQYVKVPYDAGADRIQAIANPKNRRLHEVLLTIAQAMGVGGLQDFADPKYNAGPIAELLSP